MEDVKGPHRRREQGVLTRADGWFGKCEVGEMKRCRD